MSNDKLSITKLLDITDMQRIFKAGRSTIWQWVKDGLIPAPVKLGARTTRWKADEVQKFINGLSGPSSKLTTK